MSEAVQRASGFWTLDSPLRVGGLPMGTRTSVVRLASGGLFLHSPSSLAGGAKRAIEALGEVEVIAAPNCFHYFFVQENVDAWPDARLFLAPGLRERRPKLPPGEVLGDEAPSALAPDFEQHVVAGAPRMGEVVFFHPGSRTLLLTDLAFNMRQVDGGIARFALKLMGAYGRFGPSRLARSFFKDREALRASLDRILAWDFDRIVVTHGEVVESGGRGLFEEAYRDL